MSTINVTNLSGRGGATPNLPDGANVTGVVTATSFDGSLKTTGTPTLGLGVTINASGVAISGVCTAGIVSATTFYGSGSGLTGVGETIAPWHYNPDINDTKVDVDTGIGITFNKKVEAGSGTATLKIVNAGAAGTTIQSWGVSSCTFDVTAFTMGSLVSDLIINQTYQLDIPSGFLVDSNETSYAGTAYTFTARQAANELWMWGYNAHGYLGQNAVADRSSPVQVPGTNWGLFQGDGGPNAVSIFNIKQDGSLWGWGRGSNGSLGQNDTVNRSSPVQIPGTDWSSVSHTYYGGFATKTDGTLWAWGYNALGQLGVNDTTERSSPIQIPGTTWSSISGGLNYCLATKTDGTAWAWGRNDYGNLGLNDLVKRSSPTQIPGTTWRSITGGGTGTQSSAATKTDGTLWTWGYNDKGTLGQNNRTNYSSPIQVPGTSWSSLVDIGRAMTVATRTDGTLWSWGYNGYGQLGHNNGAGNPANVSSPTQIPGTTWGTNQTYYKSATYFSLARKTDNTLWSWGYGGKGRLAQNNETNYSSPIQIPGTDWVSIQTVGGAGAAIKEDTTP